MIRPPSLTPLLLVAAVAGAGCLRLPHGEAQAAGTKAAKTTTKRRPLDAKAYLVRMNEIDRRAEILIASERRRLRRAPRSRNLKERGKVVAASMTQLDAILVGVRKGLEELGPPPAAVKRMYALRLRQADDGRARIGKLLAAVRRNDVRAFDRIQGAGDSAEARLLDATRREEKLVRKRLGMKGSPAAALVAASARTTASVSASVPAPFPAPEVDLDRSSVRERANARALVRFAGRLIPMVAAENRRQNAFQSRALAGMPRDPDAREGYVREIMAGAIALDRRSASLIRSLGTPPPGARPYVRTLLDQVRFSEGVVRTALASGADAETMVNQVESARRGLEMERRLAAVAEAAERLNDLLTEIRREGTAARSDWEPLERAAR